MLVKQDNLAFIMEKPFFLCKLIVFEFLFIALVYLLILNVKPTALWILKIVL